MAGGYGASSPFVGDFFFFSERLSKADRLGSEKNRVFCRVKQFNQNDEIKISLGQSLTTSPPLPRLANSIIRFSTLIVVTQALGVEVIGARYTDWHVVTEASGGGGRTLLLARKTS